MVVEVREVRLLRLGRRRLRPVSPFHVLVGTLLLPPLGGARFSPPAEGLFPDGRVRARLRPQVAGQGARREEVGVAVARTGRPVQVTRLDVVQLDVEAASAASEEGAPGGEAARRQADVEVRPPVHGAQTASPEVGVVAVVPPAGQVRRVAAPLRGVAGQEAVGGFPRGPEAVRLPWAFAGPRLQVLVLLVVLRDEVRRVVGQVAAADRVAGGHDVPPVVIDLEEGRRNAQIVLPAASSSAPRSRGPLPGPVARFPPAVRLVGLLRLLRVLVDPSARVLASGCAPAKKRRPQVPPDCHVA